MVDITYTAFCGVDCAACPDLTAGVCPGCRKTEWGDDPCPPVACCRERGIDRCGLCPDFPCAMMRDFYGESESHRQAGERMRALHEAEAQAPAPWRERRAGDCPVSRWSGGETRELAIAPAGARYAARDFLWRVSSATVELEESDFTLLPDYERWISTLEGEIRLRHGDGAEIRLLPLQVHRFDGAAATRSRGRCRDFNLMLRKGRAAGTMEPLCPKETPLEIPGETGETRLLFCAAGRCSVQGAGAQTALEPGDSLQTDGPAALRVLAQAPGTALLLCRIREIRAEG